MNPNQNTRSRWAKFFSVAFVVLFCVGWFARYEWNMLTGEYIHNDDNAQHVAWMWKWRPGNQFSSHDLMNEAAEQIQPWGYVALARAAMFVMDPIQFGEYLPLATLLITCLLVFFLVEKRFGIWLGMACVVLIGFLCFERMVGFNARAWGYPLLLAFLYFFADAKWRGVAICLVLSALLYPVPLLLALAILSLEAARWAWGHRRHFLQHLQPHLKTVAMLAFAAVAAMLLTFVKSRQIAHDPNLGQLFSAQELLSLPMFEPEKGRVDFHEEMRPWIQIFTNSYNDYNYSWPILATVVFFVLAHFIQRKSTTLFDRSLFYLPVAGISLFLMARWLLPLLFLPERYLTYFYPVFFSLLVVRLLGLQVDFFRKWWVGALLLTAFILPRQLNFEAKNNSQIDYSEYAPLLQSIQALPKDKGMVAAPLLASDMIPLHCARSVVFSYEGFHALYFKDYWAKMSERYYDYINAVTSSNANEVAAFVRKYDVAYLVMDKGFLEGKTQLWAFAPFLAHIKKRVKANPERNFAANQLPAALYIEVGQEYRILDCRKWLGE